LEISTCSSSEFSSASLKIAHHLPRLAVSFGCASFHAPAAVIFEGGGSLYAAGAGGASGRLYFGPTIQPALVNPRTASATQAGARPRAAAMARIKRRGMNVSPKTKENAAAVAVRRRMRGAAGAADSVRG